MSKKEINQTNENGNIEDKTIKEISVFLLNNIQNTYDKLPFSIDQIDILEYAKKELIHKKALVIAMRKSNIEYKDPITYLKEIEMLELLVNYLQNDPIVKEYQEKYEDKDIIKKDSYSLK